MEFAKYKSLPPPSRLYILINNKTCITFVWLNCPLLLLYFLPFTGLKIDLCYASYIFPEGETKSKKEKGKRENQRGTCTLPMTL